MWPHSCVTTSSSTSTGIFAIICVSGGMEDIAVIQRNGNPCVIDELLSRGIIDREQHWHAEQLIAMHRVFIRRVGMLKTDTMYQSDSDGAAFAKYPVSEGFGTQKSTRSRRTSGSMSWATLKIAIHSIEFRES